MFRSSQAKVALALLGVMIGLVTYSYLLFDPDKFGYLHDDSLYLTTAQSIANGEGYMLPSMPETVPATKYPPLFPALLSLAWLGDLGYPENVAVAQALVGLFGLLFIPACYLAIRKMGAGRVWALALTAITVFHPLFMLMQLSAASELVFFAFTYGAVVCFETSSDGERSALDRRLLWAGGAALCLAATLTRSLGLAVAIGAGGYFASRRMWLRSAGALVPGILGVLLPAYWASLQVSPSVAAAPEGYIQTITYYLSYTQFWILSVLDIELWFSRIRAFS